MTTQQLISALLVGGVPTAIFGLVKLFKQSPGEKVDSDVKKDESDKKLTQASFDAATGTVLLAGQLGELQKAEIVSLKASREEDRLMHERDMDIARAKMKVMQSEMDDLIKQMTVLRDSVREAWVEAEKYRELYAASQFRNQE